jgi:transcriptional regulator with XRE-family HTH domain
MANIGKRITQLRKAKNWPQDELVKVIEASRVMIDKYERADNLPSIEVIDKEMLKKLDELE